MGKVRVWAMPPREFTTKTGKNVVVGVKTLVDTGRVYKGTGKRERERAEKRKAKSDDSTEEAGEERRSS